MIIFAALMSFAQADDALEKKVFLLQRAIKNDDCNQASELVDKLIAENPDYLKFWQTKAEVEACLGASVFEQYLVYEKYLSLGGDYSEVSSSVEELESQLYSARVTIEADDGDLDWSQLTVSLESDRWVKESEGVYLLKYSPVQEYELLVESSSPLTQSARKILTGTGMDDITISLGQFEKATLNIDAIQEGVTLSIYTANNPDVGMDWDAGSYEVGAGETKVVASFQEKSVEYVLDVEPGSNTLAQPWTYTVVYDKQTLYSEILSPDQNTVEHEALSVSSPFQGADEIKLQFSLNQQLGQNQQVVLNQEIFDKSDLSQSLLTYESLEQRKVQKKLLNLAALGGGAAGLALSGGLQTMALSTASKANGITDVTQYTEFQDLSSTAGLQQTGAVTVAAISVLGLGSTYFLKRSIQEIEAEQEAVHKQIDDLKDEPLIVE